MRSKPMAKWQLQHAKARFSELVDDAVEKGPQIVTRRGVDTAVVVSIDEWQKSKAARPGIGKTFYSGKARDLIFQFQSAAPAGRASLRCLIDSFSD